MWSMVMERTVAHLRGSSHPQLMQEECCFLFTSMCTEIRMPPRDEQDQKYNAQIAAGS